MRLRQLTESPNTAVFAFGRMNPPTIGHKKLVDKVKAQAGVPFLFLTHSQKPKTDPLTFAEKVFFADKSFGGGIRIGDKDVRTIIQAMQKLESAGFKNIIYVAGSDRVDSFTKLLNDYNGKDYKFDSISIISAGERDPDAEGAEGMSASKMRYHAHKGEYDEFEDGVAVNDPKLAKMMFAKVRQGMGITDEGIIEDSDKEDQEVTIGDYTTTHFYMCGSAIETANKHKDKPGMEDLIRLQDMVYKLEKEVMDAGESTIEAKQFIKKLHDAVMDQAKKIGIDDEVVDYQEKHRDSILKGDPKPGFGRVDVDENIKEFIKKKELKVQQQKPKLDVLNNIAARADGKSFPLSWNAGKGEISVGGKLFVDPINAKKFVSFFDRNTDKQDAMTKALQSATTTAKLFDVLGLKYKLDMGR